MTVRAHPAPLRLPNILADLSALFAALPRAVAASAEYRKLSALTDAELTRRGLTRADLPRLIHARHFA